MHTFNVLIKNNNSKIPIVNNFEDFKINFYENTNIKNIFLYDFIIDFESFIIYYGFNYEKIVNFTVDNLNDAIYASIKIIKDLDFDIELALDMLGGSESAFINMLNNYYEIYSCLESTLRKFVEEKDYSSIRKVVHKIKGVSLYLGSEKLLEFSKMIEEKIYAEIISDDDILHFIEYHNRILSYIKQRVENV